VGRILSKLWFIIKMVLCFEHTMTPLRRPLTFNVLGTEEITKVRIRVVGSRSLQLAVVAPVVDLPAAQTHFHNHTQETCYANTP
jgi:hypothetical protein